MKIPRVVIAGTASGVGKTSISCGIMKALSKKKNIAPFKVGPDFIDPIYHRFATGNFSRNLDTFFMDKDALTENFLRGAEKKDIAIIEGVRGLYEGIDPIEEIGSTSHVSKILRTPVILVMNTRSLTKSAAAYIKGFQSLDPEINIRGVILNQVRDDTHFKKLEKAIETFTDVEIVGSVQRGAISLSSRHLGLVPLIEREDREKVMDDLGKEIESSIDLDKIKEIANEAADLEEKEGKLFQVNSELKNNKITVGIPFDKAFSFYYKENIEALEENGAKIKYFKPTEGEGLPDADSYYIGGGYPEIYPDYISNNKCFLNDLKSAFEESKPIYGECGGLMVLSKFIEVEKKRYPMAGIFDEGTLMKKSKQGLSYVIAQPTEKHFFLKDEVKGHEFHYSKMEPLPQNKDFAYRILRGKGINSGMDGLIKNRCIGSYLHIHVGGAPSWASSFLESVC
ncbi:MAG: cobyrinic acid a,c-diamide synthase [Candidatus Methanofastidiosum methylothiophilum]|uniref:Cobyrinate a,c-diamide synthase n=1 Tax=Candidatus Methanofastidiosum methylothiophilum TaxID=1705564 RepID=A0A150J043_9EURY|nr:MAG: cobyrinic acid a,c-diamide synthase [Candidatus Methanofastidiosum methylthiophilus]KYC47737.1 MAG: cobyrinic acid a,c-diamide synthase [Candidatus Methanofastidiosum methylthiophilus]KYC50508.1 MAG: cobyrinic acid a,c-diamide synthase [Candidatus Methanofastidiosum methylthiophilus]